MSVTSSHSYTSTNARTGYEDYDAILKEYYSDEMVKNVTYKNNPFFAMLSKKEDISGKVFPLPIIYGDPQGIANTIPGARGAKSESQTADFVLYRARKFGIISIDNEAMLASKDKKGAFLEIATLKTDGIMRQFSNDISTELFGDGNGILTDDAGALATLTYTLKAANRADIVFFERGMSLSNASGLLYTFADAAHTPPVITAVDRNAGTITLDKITGFNSTVGSTDTAQTFVADGDLFRADVAPNDVIKGLRAWLPSSVSGSDSFFGLNRSVDRTRLAGVYLNATSSGNLLPANGPVISGLVEGLESIITRVIMEGGSPDVIFLHPSQYNSLKVYFQGKANYQMTEVKIGDKASIDFRGIVFDSSEGPVKVIADRRCPVLEAFCLQMDTWKLFSLKSVGHIQKYDGLSMLRENDADGVEMRIASYAQLGCTAPGFNGRVTLPAPSASIY